MDTVHVAEFYIEDLAGRPGRRTFTLNPTVNVFFGLNGTGKTSLLRIVHSALSDDPSILAQVPFTRAGVRIKFGDGRELTRTFDKTVPQIRRIFEEEDETPTYYEDEPAWSDSIRGAGAISHTYLPTTRLWLNATARRVTARGISDPLSSAEKLLDADYATSLNVLWSKYAAEVSKRVQSAQEAGLVSVLTQILDAAPMPERARHAEFEGVYARVQRFLVRAQAQLQLPHESNDFLQRYNANDTLRRVVDSLNDVEEQIEAALQPRSRLEALLNKLFSNKKVSLGAGRLGIMSGEADIPLSALSAGEKQLLRLTVEVLAMTGAPIIIDEPELSLHVDWQQELVSDFRDLQPDSQLLLATHSPEIMVPVADEQVFKL